MTELLHKAEAFVHPPELIGSEASWAYLHSHRLREMNFRDQDYEHLHVASSSHPGNAASGQA